MAKNINFEFYKAEFAIKPALVDVILSEYLQSELNVKNHIFSIHGHKAFLKKLNDNVFVLLKLRDDFNPKLLNATTGDESEIGLDENTYVIEETYFYYDFVENILLYQKNGHGFSPAALEEYIKELLKDKLEKNRFILKPVLTKEGYEKLSRHEIIKNITLNVAQPSLSLLKEFGVSIDEVISMDLDALSEVEIVFKSKRKHGIFSKDTFLNLIGKFQDNPGVNKLQVNASESYESKQDTFDLLDDRYIIPHSIKTIKVRTIDRFDMIATLQKLADEHLATVKGLCDA